MLFINYCILVPLRRRFFSSPVSEESSFISSSALPASSLSVSTGSTESSSKMLFVLFKICKHDRQFNRMALVGHLELLTVSNLNSVSGRTRSNQFVNFLPTISGRITINELPILRMTISWLIKKIQPFNTSY